MATYFKIFQTEVGSGGAASIDFTSIPSTYTDLVVKISARGTNASSDVGGYLKFNGSTSGYSARLLYGSGTSATSANTSLGYLTWANDMPAASGTSNTFGNGEIYIPNYAGSQYKSLSVENVVEINSSTGNYLQLNAGLWSNTSAITSISIYPSAGNYAQYSTATLYGIKNS